MWSFLGRKMLKSLILYETCMETMPERNQQLPNRELILTRDKMILKRKLAVAEHPHQFGEKKTNLVCAITDQG